MRFIVKTWCVTFATLTIALFLCACSATQADWNPGDMTQGGWTYEGQSPCSMYYGKLAANNTELIIGCEDGQIFSHPLYH